MIFRIIKNLFFVVFIITPFGIILGSVIGLFIAVTQYLPEIRELENFKPPEVTRIYSSDNVLLNELYIENRQPVILSEVPEMLVKAILTTEDRKFYSHSGVDIYGIFRAIFKDLKAGKFVQGASTITQQLAKTLFLTSEKSFLRKIKEAFLAFQIERRYTKNEILQFYLNQIYFGNSAYGVKAAAFIFFGKALSDLTIAECALIAGIPKAPSRFAPLTNPELALKRRQVVLKQMHRRSILTETQYDVAIKEPLQLVSQEDRKIKAPYFVNYVKSYIEDNLGPDVLFKVGGTILTTLDYKIQQAAENAVNKGSIQLTERLAQFSKPDSKPQIALVALDVRKGDILAMVGGDHSDSSFNRATASNRMVGSAFKPFIYAYAIEKGYSQNSLILDAPLVYKGADGKNWHPQNYSGKYKGDMILREALAISQNTPTIRLFQRLGIEPLIEFVQNMGITSTLNKDLSLALGTASISLLELSSAYRAFANQGVWIEPVGVKHIITHRSRILWQSHEKKKVVLKRSTAAIITDMLHAVITEGTAQAAKSLSFSVAGKTGSTNDYKDALFVGFSSEIVAGVWVGFDDYSDLGRETGSKAALPIWIDFMQAIHSKDKVKPFDIPSNVAWVYINRETGKKTDKNDPLCIKVLELEYQESQPSQVTQLDE